MTLGAKRNDMSVFICGNTHIMSNLAYGVGVDGWRAFKIDPGTDFLVAGLSWMRDSRKVSGGLHLGPCLFEAG